MTILPTNQATNNNNNYDYHKEFNQLKAYYNFRIYFKKKLKEINNNFTYDNIPYHLIDRKWLQNWKNHVGYNNICKKRIDNKSYDKELMDNDYNDILNNLEAFSNQNTIFPLVNKNIFNNGNVNPISDFVVVDKNCYDSFISPDNHSNEENKSFLIMFLHEIFLLKLSETQFLLALKKDNNYWELVLSLEKIDEKALINHFSHLENIFFWIKDLASDLNSTEKAEFSLNEGTINIFNKTLFINKRNNLTNTIRPQMNNGIMQTMKLNNYISQEDKNELKKAQNTYKNNSLDNKESDGGTFLNVKNVIENNNTNNTNNMNNGNNMYNNNNMINMNNHNNMIYMNSVNNMNNINNMNSVNNMNNMNNMINKNNMINMNNMNNINYLNNANMNNMNLNNTNMNNMNYYNMNLNNMNNMNNQYNVSKFNQKTGNNENTKINPIYPHRTGLENIGQTCYMNSTIQCLSNIKYLSDYLIKHFGKFDIEKQPLSVAFSSLVYDLFTTKNKNIAPKLFKKIIGKLNPLFEGMHAADAKDLIFFLLETLHKELNKIKINSEEPNIDYAQLEKDSFNENLMLQHFIKEYTEKNKSIISDTFYGIIRSTMKCNNCNQTKYSFQTFNLLIFQLKNVKEFNQNTRNNNNKYVINIYDAFDCDKKEEVLDGENMIYCNNCKGLRSGTHQQIIYSLPRVLIIILNRGRNNLDFNENFNFPKVLDLSIEGYAIKSECNTNFYLQSVITHLGESGSGGHFIAYCRNGPKEDFLCYNDASVSKATINDAMSSNISENVYEKRTPYILVYYHMN